MLPQQAQQQQFGVPSDQSQGHPEAQSGSWVHKHAQEFQMPQQLLHEQQQPQLQQGLPLTHVGQQQQDGQLEDPNFDSAQGTGGSSCGRWQPKRPPASTDEHASAAGTATPPKEGGSGNHEGEAHKGSWEKVRVWKAVNLSEDDPQAMPLVSRAEPFAPGSGRSPSQDLVVAFLKNGDVVKQVGHSKKIRGFMVMPVRLIREGEDATGTGGGDEVEDGWVTRRQVSGGPVWFEDLMRGDA